MAVIAAAREIEGVPYPDPITFVVAGGFSAEEARSVINAYKAHYGKHPGGGDWLSHVTANTGVKDSDRAKSIMRRYRKFYGK